MVCPCGYILAFCPLFVAKSNQQILDALQSAFPDPVDRPAYVWIDKACQFWYWLLDQRHPARIQGWENTKFLVDRFHQIAGHLGEETAVARFCQDNCHFQNEAYDGLVDGDGQYLGNSEAAEQTFSRFVKFGSMCTNMTFQHQQFFLFMVCETMNELLCWKMRRSGVAVNTPERPLL